MSVLDAAASLKKKNRPSRLTTGKIWNLANPDSKGILSNRSVLLCFCGMCQNLLEVFLNSLNLAVPSVRKHDTSGSLLKSGALQLSFLGL